MIIIPIPKHCPDQLNATLWNDNSDNYIIVVSTDVFLQIVKR